MIMRKGVSTVISVSTLARNMLWSNMYSPPATSNLYATLSPVKQWDNLSLPTYSERQQQYKKNITDFSSSVRDLSSSAKTLNSSKTFDHKAVSGDAKGAVTGFAKDEAKEAQYNVSVSQLAVAQQNNGKNLTGNSYGAVASGVHTFGIQAGSGAEKQISVNVSATDNNKQVLTKFANAINNSGAGVTAEIKTKDNQQYLSIVSKDTGAANAFTIRDVNGTGVSNLQLDTKVQSGGDSKYTVDGTSYQTASNKVALDNGNVTLNLNKITTSTTKVTVAKDDSPIISGAKAMVANYNRLHDVLSNSDTTKRGGRIFDGIEAAVNGSRSSDFSSIGISMNQDGELALDEKKLAAAVDNDPSKVKKLFSGAGGLAKGIENVAKELSNNSVTSYLKSPGRFNISDYSSQVTSNSWVDQQNSYTQGLFFNMTV